MVNTSSSMGFYYWPVVLCPAAMNAVMSALAAAVVSHIR
jgi:hypothetical protein